ncbi:hypothetical protein [Paenisporosarcina sp. NPDC076898]|uniref:hypothetical protein n=1 Tax=unclassified Paenisporosarcina TaxID=2642018 RepID=UPI003CFD624C
MSERSVVKFGVHVGKTTVDVGKKQLHVGKIAIHVGIHIYNTPALHKKGCRAKRTAPFKAFKTFYNAPHAIA